MTNTDPAVIKWYAARAVFYERFLVDTCHVHRLAKFDQVLPPVINELAQVCSVIGPASVQMTVDDQTWRSPPVDGASCFWTGPLEVAHTPSVGTLSVSIRTEACPELCDAMDKRLRQFLANVARAVARTVLWRRSIAEAATLAQHYEHANTALRGVLEHVEREKQRLQEGIGQSLVTATAPLLELIERALQPCDRNLVEMMRAACEELAAPYVRRLADRHPDLTRTETNVCRYIRRGLSTKEIARLMHVSTRTIETHRRNIRKKLGLKHRRPRLPEYLTQLPDTHANRSASPGMARWASEPMTPSQPT